MPTTKTCAIAGCDRPVESHGFCAMHAQRFRRYGDPLYITPESKRRATNRAAQLARINPNDVKPTTYRKLHGRHEHRVVAEQMIGRPLLPSEVVHHIDGNKHNNDPSNLQIMTPSEHSREHWWDESAKIEWQGESLFPSEWAKKLGMSRQRFQARYKAGWSMERIASTPVRKWSRASA